MTTFYRWSWGYLGLAVVGAIWNKLHPRVVTPQERAIMACVADWMDVRKVGEFALPKTPSGFAEVGKRCEHVETRR